MREIISFILTFLPVIVVTILSVLFEFSSQWLLLAVPMAIGLGGLFFFMHYKDKENE